METEYSEIQSIDDYDSYLTNLKQIVLLKIHLRYRIEEIENYIAQLKLEDEIREIILDFSKKTIKEDRIKLIDEKDENKLVKLWYEQYRDFGIKDSYKHYPDLIIFDFQKKEIENLVKKFSRYMNTTTYQLIDELLEKLYHNKYKSFISFLLDYYRNFGVKFYRKKDEKARKMIHSYHFPENHIYGDFIGVKNTRPIVLFITSLRLIVLGGQYNKEKDRYIPFFMDNDDVNETIKRFLTTRLKQMIKIYYPHLLKTLKFPKEFLYANRYLNLPLINLGIFKEINWDFMPEAYFYDGVAVKRKEKKKSFYAIYTHPLSLFYSFFNRKDFEIFIDQLLHHELIHIQQYRYVFIHDKLLTNTKWFSQHQTEAITIKRLAKKQWVADELPKSSKERKIQSYVMGKGGHTKRFITEVNKFKNCKKAMDSRGKIVTLYASYYYKMWGKTMPTGYWYLCSAKKEK